MKKHALIALGYVVMGFLIVVGFRVADWAIPKQPNEIVIRADQCK
jgi:hypothetical protein